MGAVTALSSAREALGMVRAGLGYLAAATAARASFLAVFTAGQGYVGGARPPNKDKTKVLHSHGPPARAG